MQEKAANVANMLGCDENCVSKSKGIFTYRKGFFYKHGGSVEKLVERVKALFPQVTIVDSGEVWKPFKGGATLAKQSHWFVKFTLPE